MLKELMSFIQEIMYSMVGEFTFLFSTFFYVFKRSIILNCHYKITTYFFPFLVKMQLDSEEQLVIHAFVLQTISSTWLDHVIWMILQCESWQELLDTTLIGNKFWLTVAGLGCPMIALGNSKQDFVTLKDIQILSMCVLFEP